LGFWTLRIPGKRFLQRENTVNGFERSGEYGGVEEFHNPVRLVSVALQHAGGQNPEKNWTFSIDQCRM